MSPDWMRQAKCRGMDPELFMPHQNDNLATVRAKAVCAGCQVQTTCLSWALENVGTRDAGVWGGASDHQRYQMKHRRRTA